MINNKYSNRYVKIIEWIFLYLSITDSLSFLMGDSTLSLKFLSPFVLVTKVLLIVYFFVLALKLDIPFNYNMLWLPLVIWLVYFFSSINGELYFGLLGLMILCGFCVLPNIVKANIYRKYRLWIIVMSILGIIAYLSYSLNLGLPYKIVDFYSVGVEGLYIDYFFSVLLKGVFDLRLCGLFNEPGFLGTIIALILIIEKCNLKKVGNVIMLIAGVLTFSFAFYVILIIYFLMRMLKRPLTVIAIFSIFAVFMNYIQNIRFENSQVQYIVNHFVFDFPQENYGRCIKRRDKGMRKVRRKLHLLLFVLIMVVPVLSACHGSKGLKAFALPEAFDETREYEITFWAKNDTQTMIYEKTIADFEKLYPNIKVNLRLYTD